MSTGSPGRGRPRQCRVKRPRSIPTLGDPASGLTDKESGDETDRCRIDGSQAAIRAAFWGVDEAISRSVPLRLVSVLKSTHLSPDDYDRDLEHAEISLREAQSAVEADGRSVKIETETRHAVQPGRFWWRRRAMPR